MMYRRRATLGDDLTAGFSFVDPTTPNYAQEATDALSAPALVSSGSQTLSMPYVVPGFTPTAALVTASAVPVAPAGGLNISTLIWVVAGAFLFAVFLKK